MYLSEINIYPVKSLAGIGLNESVIEDRGLSGDRRWMLIDKTNRFMSQREMPRMATLRVGLDGGSLHISANGDERTVAAEPETGLSATVQIWSSSVKAAVYDDETNAWFSDRLGTKCRLVRMPEETKRKVNFWYAVHKNVDLVSFADGYPFMLIGQGSLDDLNSRLTEPVPMNRFRPNFVVAGAGPFAEDSWKKIRIGETLFHIVKPCARCMVPTVDQLTGEKGKEPIKTLAKYRNIGGKVLFGQNLIAEAPGNSIKIGDKVEIVESAD